MWTCSYNEWTYHKYLPTVNKSRKGRCTRDIHQHTLNISTISFPRPWKPVWINDLESSSFCKLWAKSKIKPVGVSAASELGNRLIRVAVCRCEKEYGTSEWVRTSATAHRAPMLSIFRMSVTPGYMSSGIQLSLLPARYIVTCHDDGVLFRKVTYRLIWPFVRTLSVSILSLMMSRVRWRHWSYCTFPTTARTPYCLFQKTSYFTHILWNRKSICSIWY